MMDVVERLRQGERPSPMERESAHEIERLRAALEHYAKIDMWW